MSTYHLLYAPFYENYIQLATKHGKISKALKQNTKQLLTILENIPRKKIDYAYAEGKWTIKQLVQHMIDAERVFAYRALRFARYDQTPLAGFDENKWAESADVSARGWKEMLREFSQLRKSNILMIASFSKEELAATGTASEKEISVAALCFIIAGHAEHHLNILRERYL